MAGNHIDGFHRVCRARRIIPVADDMEVGRGALHHARGVKNFLGQAHAVHLAADPQDFAALLPAIGVGVRPVNRGVGGILGTRGIGIVNPAADEIEIIADAGEGEGLGIPTVTIHAAFFETEMRRGKVVPNAARVLRRGNPPSRSRGHGRAPRWAGRAWCRHIQRRRWRPAW